MKTVTNLLLLILIVLTTSCNSSVKNTTSEEDERSRFNKLTPQQQDSVRAEEKALRIERERIEKRARDIQDSIRAEEKALHIEREKAEKRARGIYEGADTIQFVGLQILLDKAVPAPLPKHTRVAIDRNYYMYMTFTNTSKTQTVPIPFIFMDHMSNRGTEVVYGTRIFMDEKTRLPIKSYDILPGKTVKGYYITGVTPPSTQSFYLYYGDVDEDNEIPEGYENKKVTIRYKSKIVREEEK